MPDVFNVGADIPIRAYYGKITAVSAVEGDPAVVTYSAIGWGSWDHRNVIDVSNKVADNPVSLDVINTSAKVGDLCEIVVDTDGSKKLFLFTSGIPGRPCPA